MDRSQVKKSAQLNVCTWGAGSQKREWLSSFTQIFEFLRDKHGIPCCGKEFGIYPADNEMKVLWERV